MMPFQEPTLVVRWQWGCHPPLVALTKAPGYIHVLSMSQHSHLYGEKHLDHASTSVGNMGKILFDRIWSSGLTQREAFVNLSHYPDAVTIDSPH